MKQINIIGSQMVDGKLRYQHENPIDATNAEADRLLEAGALLDDPAEKPVKAKAATKRSKPAPEKPTKPETIEPSIPADADNG